VFQSILAHDFITISKEQKNFRIGSAKRIPGGFCCGGNRVVSVILLADRSNTWRTPMLISVQGLFPLSFQTSSSQPAGVLQGPLCSSRFSAGSWCPVVVFFSRFLLLFVFLLRMAAAVLLPVV
jgi:hypothetical protein